MSHMTCYYQVMDATTHTNVASSSMRCHAMRCDAYCEDSDAGVRTHVLKQWDSWPWFMSRGSRLCASVAVAPACSTAGDHRQIRMSACQYASMSSVSRCHVDLSPSRCKQVDRTYDSVRLVHIRTHQNVLNNIIVCINYAISYNECTYYTYYIIC